MKNNSKNINGFQLIEDVLSNNESDNDQEIVQMFTENGIDEALAIKIVKHERPKFFKNPFHRINYSLYLDASDLLQTR